MLHSSVEFQKEFILPKNEPLVELKLALAKKPKISPLLSNMRSIDESKLPYQCGIIFFFHIACTGGSAMNKWLGKQVKLMTRILLIGQVGEDMMVERGYL